MDAFLQNCHLTCQIALINFYIIAQGMGACNKIIIGSLACQKELLKTEKTRLDGGFQISRQLKFINQPQGRTAHVDIHGAQITSHWVNTVKFVV